MALLIGFLLVALVGVAHQVSLRGLDKLVGPEKEQPSRSIIVVFIGLLAIHTCEIVLFASAYRILLALDWMGTFTAHYDGSWSDLIYFSGINFVTLGYTQIQTEGPIRMISMMQSLGGFMLLTWSATFIYSAWERAFRE